MQRSQIEAIVRASILMLAIGGASSYTFLALRRAIVIEMERELLRRAKKGGGGGTKAVIPRGFRWGLPSEEDDDEKEEEKPSATEEEMAREVEEKPQVKAILKKIRNKNLTKKQYRDLIQTAADETDSFVPLLRTAPVIFIFTFLVVLIMDLIIAGAVNTQKEGLFKKQALKALVVATVTTAMYLFISQTKRPSRLREVALYSVILSITAVGADSFIESVIL